MPKYNLNALGWEEFERLCQALVQEIIGSGAKVYGMGKDGAREATFHGKASYPSEKEQWDGDWIIQAKFHDVQQIGPGKAREGLIKDLDNELSMITGKYSHPCDNYILVTNVSLTPAFQKGTKDRIDREVIPKYPQIRNIHVWGAEELCRHLDRFPDIRKTYIHFLITGDIIARLLEILDEEGTYLDEIVKLYCQGCFDHEQFIALHDMGDVEDDRITLQGVFVDLDVIPSELPREEQRSKGLPNWLLEAASDRNRTSTLSYLLDDNVSRLVLVGGPGSGKSTLAQYIAQIYRARLVGRLDDLCQDKKVIRHYENCIPRIPFRVLLREYSQWISKQEEKEKPDNLFCYLETQFSQESGGKVNSKDIQSIVKSNASLLILDGLDEVPDKSLKAKVIDNITSFVHQVEILKGNLKVVATTRPYGYSNEFDPNRRLHLTLQNMKPNRATDYAQRWVNSREPVIKERERLIGSFSLCLKSEVTAVLTQTPLQVTILLVIIRASGMPPKQREELFEEYTRIIYLREQKKSSELLRTGKDMIYGLHKYLAYILHRQAERDRTGALMDMSQFREEVMEYLHYFDPGIKGEQLESETNHIISEASERLVLIESPYVGRFGFGLTIMREFFAAAHLVDTCRDTKEMNARFKAIARSPYWHNVALFFAGRVGRMRQGEVSSLIDVCRDIDAEGADRFLRRGTELAMEIVDDQALRLKHTERGAIQYSLERLNAGFVEYSHDWIGKLRALSKEYKDNIVLPWLEEKLRTIIPENLHLYSEAYQELFGFRKPLRKAIQRASEYYSENTKLWALSQAVRNRDNATWVIELLEELINSPSIRERQMVKTLSSHWSNIRWYLNFPISPRGRAVLAGALLRGVVGNASVTQSLSLTSRRELEKIKPGLGENHLFVWAVSQILILSRTPVEGEHRLADGPVRLRIPYTARQGVGVWVNENMDSIQRCYKTFLKEEEPFTKILMEILELLADFGKVYKIIRAPANYEEARSYLLEAAYLLDIRLASEIPCQARKRLCAYHEHRKYEDKYWGEIEEFSAILNKETDSIPHHPYRLLIWIFSDYDPMVEKFLDPSILGELRTCLSKHSIAEDILQEYIVGSMIKSDLELCKLALDVTEKQLSEGKERLWPLFGFGWYAWDQPKEERDVDVMTQLKRVFKKVIRNISNFINSSTYYHLSILYEITLRAGAIEEIDMAMLYEIVKEVPNFADRLFLREVQNEHDILSFLVDMFRSDDLRVVRLSAISLLELCKQSRSIRYSESGIIPILVGEKLRKLAEDTEDIWCSRYIEAMRFCKLKWSEHTEELLAAIRGADTEELQVAWCAVISSSHYATDKDREAFYDILLHILDPQNDFADPIKSAAFRRLTMIVYEIEVTEFDEASLGLPLSRH